MTPEEIELLSQLTVVIPTYNRPLELERSIEYWRDTPVTVHILDGSDKPWFPVGVLPGASNITYHNVPPRLDELWRDNYVRRLEFGVTLADTSYSALCGDDDSFSVAGLLVLLKFLEKNLEIDAVVGRTLGFYPHKSSVRWWLRHGVGSADNSFSGDADAVVRLRCGKLRLFYGVVKTDLWKKRIQTTKKHAWLGLRWETLFEDVSRALFRAISINQIVWFRFKTSHHPHEATAVYLREWANGQGNSYEVNSYIDILVEAVCLGNPGLDQHQIKKKIRKFVQNHPESRGQFPRFKTLKINVLTKLFSRLDENIVNSLPTIFRKIVMRYHIPAKIASAIGPKKVLDEFLPSFLKSGISFDLDELKNLEKLWLKPREELRLKANI